MQGLITDEQAQNLWARWTSMRITAPPVMDTGPRFGFTNVLYYFGGMVAIGAMTLFMTLGWQKFGDWGLFAIAAAYLVACLVVAANLLARHLPPPAGRRATPAVCLGPPGGFAARGGLGRSVVQ